MGVAKRIRWCQAKITTPVYGTRRCPYRATSIDGQWCGRHRPNRQCAATIVNGRQCKMPAVENLTLCVRHQRFKDARPSPGGRGSLIDRYDATVTELAQLKRRASQRILSTYTVDKMFRLESESRVLSSTIMYEYVRELFGDQRSSSAG